FFRYIEKKSESISN
ncbi:amino ABC transporter, permease, 3-TM region, His/Glu/Gln/Arg/opine family domain protein, partial [Vibrio harveyi]